MDRFSAETGKDAVCMIGGNMKKITSLYSGKTYKVILAEEDDVKRCSFITSVITTDYMEYSIYEDAATSFLYAVEV